MIPESVRWLQMHGRFTEAFEVLKSISNANNIPFTNDVYELQRESAQNELNEKKVSSK